MLTFADYQSLIELMGQGNVMSKWMAMGAAIALTAMGAAQAQTTFHWPAPQANQGEGVRYYLPMGTPLMLRTLTQISTKDNKPGDRVYLEVAENISFRGQIIIPIGSPVVAEVSRLQRNGHFGVKGKLEIRLIRVQTPSGPVRLTGTSYDEGKSGTVLSVGAMLAVGIPLGLLVHGTSGQINPGTPVQAALGDDLKFRWFPQKAESTSLPATRAISDSAEAGNPGFEGVR